MPHDDPKTLVSTEWLAAHLKDPDLRVIDATYYLPGDHRNAQEEYNEEHIPGARFFDIDDICDQRSDLPHMVPSVEKFMSRMRAMGIGDGHQVVVYDTLGMMSASAALVEGIELTMRELLNVFTKHGMEIIVPQVGDRFDPQLHQAMFEAPLPGTTAGDIIQIAAEGFMLHDRLLRPAQVGVSSTPKS